MIPESEQQKVTTFVIQGELINSADDLRLELQRTFGVTFDPSQNSVSGQITYLHSILPRPIIIQLVNAERLSAVLGASYSELIENLGKHNNLNERELWMFYFTR